MASYWVKLSICAFILYFCVVHGSEKSAESKQDAKWKKKDIRDYTDADLERLLDQWEENDEDELEEDEKPKYKQKRPTIDMNKIDPKDPESVMKNAKKGQTLMMFVSVSGNPSQRETEEISGLWQQGLYNGNIELQRYVTSPDRVLFVLQDGALAWTVKNYLIAQDRCKDVTIEGKVYPGAGSVQKENVANKKTTKKSEKKTKSSLENETRDKEEL
ncbi:LDLR chaperone boca-like [Tubulanus polymorphus]|uniref:LDLR chaperone boca-like n=1 Tax=Tubulanus polymorphus TaxID=672921 RepID=UPI003DA49E20